MIRKQTRQGWDHTVCLTFKRKNKDKSSATYILEWGKCGNSKTRTLPFSAIEEIKLEPKYNGQSFTFAVL